MSESCLVSLRQLARTSFVPSSTLWKWGRDREGDGPQRNVVLAVSGYTCPTGVTYLVMRVESHVTMPPQPSVPRVITQTLPSATTIIYNSKRPGPLHASEAKDSPDSARLCSSTQRNISSSHFWLLNYVFPKEQFYLGTILLKITVPPENSWESGRSPFQLNAIPLCQSIRAYFTTWGPYDTTARTEPRPTLNIGPYSLLSWNNLKKKKRTSHLSYIHLPRASYSSAATCFLWGTKEMGQEAAVLFQTFPPTLSTQGGRQCKPARKLLWLSGEFHGNMEQACGTKKGWSCILEHSLYEAYSKNNSANITEGCSPFLCVKHTS